MAKKNEVTERDAIQEEDVVENGEVEPADPSAFSFDTDFNATDEYKVPPLVPGGKYEGYVTQNFFDAKLNALVWVVTLRADSDVMMSDNETPVDGNVLYYKNWFPRAGDDETRTKTGKMTKRQAKINMLHDFSQKMRIDMSTPALILQGVSNAEWIGLEVIVTVEIREYEGRLSNQIQDMTAA